MHIFLFLPPPPSAWTLRIVVFFFLLFLASHLLPPVLEVISASSSSSGPLPPSSWPFPRWRGWTTCRRCLERLEGRWEALAQAGFWISFLLRRMAQRRRKKRCPAQKQIPVKKRRNAHICLRSKGSPALAVKSYNFIILAFGQSLFLEL